MATHSQTTRPGSATTNQVINRPGFAEPALCERLIAFWERHRDLTSREFGPVAFFDSRVMHVRETHTVDERLGLDLLELGHRMALEIAAAYAIDRLYPDDVQIVKWWEGHEMHPHADREHPDGSEHGTPWRAFAGVIYLNDNYRGGQIHFPQLGIELAPAQGTFLGFGGGLDFLHGVKRIESGVRYTCPSWFTHNRAHAVDLYLRQYS